MKEAIYNFIRGWQNVTFPDLEKHIDGFRGEMEMTMPEQNIVLWSRVSEEGAEALKQLLDEKKIAMRPSHVLCYVHDGAMIKLPIAKKVPKNGYKKPHWLPVGFYSIETKESIGEAREVMHQAALDALMEQNGEPCPSIE